MKISVKLVGERTEIIKADGFQVEGEMILFLKNVVLGRSLRNIVVAYNRSRVIKIKPL